MSVNHLRRISFITILGVLSYLVMLVEVPVVPLFPFLKFDVSDTIALVGGVLMGSGAASLIILVKLFLHLMIHGFNPLTIIGDTASLLASLSFILPLLKFSQYQEKLAWAHHLVGIVGASVLMTLIMVALNYGLLLPAYMALAHFSLATSMVNYLVLGIVPLNLVKGLVNGLLGYALAERLAQPLKSKF